MALPLSNSFETGLADETLITAANSDDGSAGNAFDAIGGELRFDDARAAHGSLSCRVVIDAAEVGNIDWSSAIGTVTELGVRGYFYFDHTPTSQHRLIRLKNSSNVDTCYAVLHTDGDIYCFDAVGGFYQITTNCPQNEWVRIELRVVASTTVGIVHVKLFQHDSTTLFGEASGTNVNTGADIDVLAIGNCTASNVGTFWMDDLAAVASGFPGPVSDAIPYQRRLRALSWLSASHVRREWHRRPSGIFVPELKWV